MPPGDFIEWTVNSATAGSFLLKFRYANGGTTNRPLQLKINGTIVATGEAFPSTGGWAIWSVSSSDANLIAGVNKIRLTTIGSNGPNVDNLNYSSSIKHTLYMVDNGFNKFLFLNQKDPSKNWTVSIPSGWPFNSFLVPGIILSSLLGIAPIGLTVALIKKPAYMFAERFNFYRDMYWGWTYCIYVAFTLII